MAQQRLPERSPTPSVGQRQRFLMVVKTYPSPSKRYGETVCCAGWDEAGNWVRIFPVNFRSLDEYATFRKWQWIEASWEPAKDGRPESRHIHQDSITAGEFLPAGRGWEARRRWLDPLVVDSLEDLTETHRTKGVTLGVIRPKEILKLEIRRAQGWDPDSKTELGQLSLEWTGDRTPRGGLEIIPYDFLYHFRCRGDRCTTVHRMEIFDWEAAEAKMISNLPRVIKVILATLTGVGLAWNALIGRDRYGNPIVQIRPKPRVLHPGQGGP